MPKVTPKQFVLFTVGIPSSGKTHFVTTELIPYLSEVDLYADPLSSDDIVKWVAGIMKEKYDIIQPKIIKQADNIIENRLFMSTFMNMNVILDQANLTTGIRKNRLTLIQNYDKYNKVAIVFDPKMKEVVERNSKRTDRLVDNVELNRSLEAYSKPTLDEGFNEVLTVNEFRTKYLVK